MQHPNIEPYRRYAYIIYITTPYTWLHKFFVFSLHTLPGPTFIAGIVLGPKWLQTFFQNSWARLWSSWEESGSQDKPNKSYYDPRKWIRSLALECCSCSAWKGIFVCVFSPWTHGARLATPKMMEKTRTNIEASIFLGGSHFSQTNSNGHQLSERDGVSWGLWPPTNRFVAYRLMVVTLTMLGMHIQVHGGLLMFILV